MTRNTELERLRAEATSPGDFCIDIPVVPLYLVEAIMAMALLDAERWRYARRVLRVSDFDYEPSRPDDRIANQAIADACDRAMVLDRTKA